MVWSVARWRPTRNASVWVSVLAVAWLCYKTWRRRNGSAVASRSRPRKALPPEPESLSLQFLSLVAFHRARRDPLGSEAGVSTSFIPLGMVSPDQGQPVRIAALGISALTVLVAFLCGAGVSNIAFILLAAALVAFSLFKETLTGAKGLSRDGVVVAEAEIPLGLACAAGDALLAWCAETAEGKARGFARRGVLGLAVEAGEHQQRQPADGDVAGFVFDGIAWTFGDSKPLVGGLTLSYYMRGSEAARGPQGIGKAASQAALRLRDFIDAFSGVDGQAVGADGVTRGEFDVRAENLDTFVGNMVHGFEENAPPPVAELLDAGWKDYSSAQAEIYLKFLPAPSFDQLACVRLRTESFVGSFPLLPFDGDHVGAGALPILLSIGSWPEWFPFCNEATLLKRFAPGRELWQLGFKLTMVTAEIIGFVTYIDSLETCGYVDVICKSLPIGAEGFWLGTPVPEQRASVRPEASFRLRIRPTALDKAAVELQSCTVTGSDRKPVEFATAWVYKTVAHKVVSLIAKRQATFPGSDTDRYYNSSDGPGAELRAVLRTSSERIRAMLQVEEPQTASLFHDEGGAGTVEAPGVGRDAGATAAVAAAPDRPGGDAPIASEGKP